MAQKFPNLERGLGIQVYEAQCSQTDSAHRGLLQRTW